MTASKQPVASPPPEYRPTAVPQTSSDLKRQLDVLYAHHKRLMLNALGLLSAVLALANLWDGHVIRGPLYLATAVILFLTSAALSSRGKVLDRPVDAMGLVGLGLIAVIVMASNGGLKDVTGFAGLLFFLVAGLTIYGPHYSSLILGLSVAAIPTALSLEGLGLLEYVQVEQEGDHEGHRYRAMMIGLMAIGGCVLQWVRLHNAQSTVLLHAVDEIDASRQAETRVLYAVSHELRNPLNGIVALLHEIKAHAKTLAEAREAAATALQTSQRLTAILDDLHTLDAFEAGHTQLTAMSVDLCDWRDGQLLIWQAMAREKKLDFVLQWDAHVPRFVLLDERRFEHLVSAVISNAFKFTEEGSVRLSVGWHDDELLLEVSDTGIGIPSTKMPTIFKPFSKVDSGFARRNHGTGLGLAIAKDIVDAMGGHIEVTSELGLGTLFRLTIPAPMERLREEAWQHMQAPQMAPKSEETGPLFAGLRVLCIDDDLLSLKGVGQMLERARASVTMAHSAVEAIELAAAQEFDLILSDISMPRFDGVAMLGAIRAFKKHLPAIAVTGHVSAEDVRRFKQAGYAHVVSKPLHPDALFEAIDKVLHPVSRAVHTEVAEAPDGPIGLAPKASE